MYQRVDLFVSHAPVFYDFGISALVQSKKPDFGLSGLFLFSSQKKSSLVVALCCVEPGFSPAQDVFSAIADRSSAQKCLADCAVVLFSATESFGTHLVFTCPVFAICVFAIVAGVVFPAACCVVSGTGRRGRIVYASHQNGMFGAERFTPRFVVFFNGRCIGADVGSCCILCTCLETMVGVVGDDVCGHFCRVTGLV